MDQQLYKGNISFINYEKHFATIEYLHNNKQRSVNCKTNEDGKNVKTWRLGDTVSFQLKLSDRGDKMTAHEVKFLHNTGIDLLIQKATLENRFSGYLKIVEDRHFVKEWESYILFPLQLSPWEIPPVETATNEAISFRFINLDKPATLVAELFSHNYIPEYRKAIQHFNNKIEIQATVYKISPHAVYMNLFSDKIQAKLPLADIAYDSLKEGDVFPVLITHLTTTRIVIKRVENEAPI